MALGFDWGVNTLLTGTLGRLTGKGQTCRVVTDGRPLVFDATTISAALHRLRGHREHLAAKRDHYRALADGLGSPHPARAGHLERARVLEVEHGRVCARIRHLNTALARSAARWAVDQAAALGASVIYLEDLATLEARGHRKGNARLSGQVRGTLAEAIRHLAAKAQIAVVTVPARGTSKLCPGCLSTLTHHPAPDRLTERGWKWAHCTGCGLSMDRDHAAARRIVSRGLLAQTHTTTDRTTGARTIRTTIEGTVAPGPAAEEDHPPPAPPAPRAADPAPAGRAEDHPRQRPPHPHQAQRPPRPRRPARGRTSPCPQDFPPYARRAYGPRHHPHPGDSGPASGGA